MSHKSFIISRLVTLRKGLLRLPKKMLLTFLISFSYALILFLVPNQMTFAFLVTLLFFVILTYVVNNILASLFIIFLISSQFYLPAKSYPFLIASTTQYRYDLFPGGVFDSVDITITDIAGSFIGVYFLRKLAAYLYTYIHVRQKFSNLVIFLSVATCSFLMFIGISIYSTKTYSPFPLQGILIITQELKLLVALWGTYYLLIKKSAVAHFYSSIASIYFFECIIGIYKFINNLTLAGLLSRAPLQDIEQGTIITRTGGVFEPNTQALHISILLFISLPFVWKLKKKALLFGYVGIGVFNIITTQSRTIWFSLIILLMLNVSLLKTQLVISFLRKTSLRNLIPLGFFSVLLFILVVNPRLQMSSLFFKYEGGGALRLEMAHEGLQLLASSPFTGYGVGSGLQIFFDNFPNGYISTFPHPVHNTYLQLALESGAPALLFFLIPFYLIFRKNLFFASSVKKGTDIFFKKIAVYPIFMYLFYFLSQPIYLRNEAVLIGISLCIALYYSYDNINGYA